ncbi:MAG: helix-turn-helix domain-containing protein [Leptospirillia bacterium]
MGEILQLPKLFYLNEVASYLEVSTDTLRRDIRAGLLGFHRIGNKYRFTEEQIVSYLNVRRTDPCRGGTAPDRLENTGSPGGQTAVSGAERGSTTNLDRHAAHRSAQTLLKKPRSR